MQRLVVQPHHCTGCKACEMACAFTHGANGNPAPSRCSTVVVGQDAYVPMLCMQCDNAACVQVCPVGAIAMDEATRVVRVNDEKCIECMACTVACPFGNMQRDPVTRKLLKCDLCAEHGHNPRCAMFCPTGALTVES